jgi:GNAT superfamily N-acetyltransferase
VSESLAIVLSRWNYFTDHSEHRWWVVFYNRLWVAYGCGITFDRTTFYMGPDHVLKEMRGHGLQRKLIYARERWARAEGFTKAVAVIAHDNIYSANNYIKCNYLLRKPWPGTDPKDCCLYFEKDLT